MHHEIRCDRRFKGMTTCRVNGSNQMTRNHLMKVMKAHYTEKNKKTFKQKKVKNFLINGKQNSLNGMLF